MSYKLDGESIAPEVFTFSAPSSSKRKGKKSKGKGKAQAFATTAGPSGSSQQPQPPQPSKPSQPTSTGTSTNPIAPETDFWDKPPGFCDITLKEALAPIKRDGVEIPAAITESHVIRYAAAEIERINKLHREKKEDDDEEGDSMEGMSWYLGQEDVERRQAAARRAKYAGNRKGKGKANGKLATLSQLRAAAAAKMASSPLAAPSVLGGAPQKNNGKQAGRQSAQVKPTSRNQPIPIDSGSDSDSEYHDADCECGCVSESEFEDEQEEGQQLVAAAQTTQQRRPSRSSQSSSQAQAGSEDEYDDSECGCEGEHGDSDCDFYPAELYSSEVYFEVPKSNAASASASIPTRSARPRLTAERVELAMERLKRSVGGLEMSSALELERAPRGARPRLLPHVVSKCAISNCTDTQCVPKSDNDATTMVIRHELDVSNQSPAAKRRRPATQDHYGPPYVQRISSGNVVRTATLGQLVLDPGGPAEFNFEYTRPIRQVPMREPQRTTAKPQTPNPVDKPVSGLEEIERQRQFLETLLADHRKMERRTAEIVSASVSLASSSQYLPSPPDSSPGPEFDDDDVLVVRRPSLPDFDITSKELDVEDYDSETDAWTFIQRATARDIMRVERAGAEPSVDMLARLQKSSRREAFSLWRKRLRSRQAEAAKERQAPPPMRTSLPIRPRTGQKTYTSKKKDAFTAGEAGITAQDRATAMKLQLEAVMGTPSLDALVEAQTSRAARAPKAEADQQTEKDRAAAKAAAALEAHLQSHIQDQIQSETRPEELSQQSFMEANRLGETTLSARHSSALRALALDLQAETQALEEQAFAEVRELALQARESGRFRPLRRAPTPVPVSQRGRAPDSSSRERRLHEQKAFYAQEAEEMRETKRASVREDMRERARGVPVQAGPTHADTPPQSRPNPSYVPPATRRRYHPGYRTPEYLFEIGWDGWTNSTPEEEKEQREWEAKARRRWNYRTCPLAWRAERREERSRTTFGCLLCVEGHLVSF